MNDNWWFYELEERSFCVNLNVEDRILNFKIFEGSMFFYEVSWFDDRKLCYFFCFIVGIIMMFLCFR